MPHAKIERKIRALDLEIGGCCSHAFTSISTQVPYKLCYLIEGPDHPSVAQTDNSFICSGKMLKAHQLQ